MFNNETRNQHYISQVEQKLNSIDPTLPRERRRIYKFKLVDREQLTSEMVNPNGVRIEKNLSFNDLYTFDIFSDNSRNNFELFFGKYEDKIEVTTNNIITKLRNEDSIAIEELKVLIFSKLMNFIRNPFCIEKILNTYGELSKVSPTDPILKTEFQKISKKNIHISKDTLSQLNVTEDIYIEWLKVLFNFFSVKMGDKFLGEMVIDNLLDIDNKRIHLTLFTYQRENCLLSDRSFVDYGPALPKGFFCFAFNLNKNTFISFNIFENTIENLKAYCPQFTPILETFEQQDITEYLPPRIEVLVVKDNIEALKGYNTQVIYQCHSSFYGASASFLCNN
ncbi:hypothetical protein [Acinetobacter pittii]|uniref:hypothetical protein n=1 Tax=Acinetobacter pittii TaxID=48296 RepID=UPI0030188EAA